MSAKQALDRNEGLPEIAASTLTGAS